MFINNEIKNGMNEYDTFDIYKNNNNRKPFNTFRHYLIYTL